VIRIEHPEGQAYAISWPLVLKKFDKNIKRSAKKKTRILVNPIEAVQGLTGCGDDQAGYFFFISQRDFANVLDGINFKEDLFRLMRNRQNNRLIVVHTPRHPENYAFTFDDCNERLDAPEVQIQKPALYLDEHVRLFQAQSRKHTHLFKDPIEAKPALDQGYRRLAEIFVQLREAGRIFKGHKKIPELAQVLRKFYNHRQRFLDQMTYNLGGIIRTLDPFSGEEQISCLEYVFRRTPEVPEYSFGTMTNSTYRSLLNCVTYISAVREEVETARAEAGRIWTPEIFRQRVKKVVDEDRSIAGNSNVNFAVQRAILPGSYGSRQ
jgi:hypothetical protein